MLRKPLRVSCVMGVCMFEVLFNRPGSIGAAATFRDKAEADAFAALLETAGYNVKRLYA